ncbi:MAG: hypothetical protein K8F91_00775, partial [Candidatus Obscuribacterales bacterium]|nr:hypothetical protein [Candidatus Obscuribacterales bacterium]
QQLEILKGALKGGGEGLKTLATDVVLLAKGLGDIFQFTQDVMSNDPRALETAAHAGEAIGKTLVGGIRLFQMSHDYLYNIGFTGDYGKPFRDVAAFSDELNDRWNKLSPGQKAKVSAKLSTEILGGLAVPLGAAKLAKSERVVQTLEEIASRARKLGQSAKDKTGKFIGSVIDELTQPVAVTPDGQRIKIPREPQKAEALHMDRHDEPHPKNPASHLDQSRPIERPEHIRISDGFFGELIKAFDLLSPEQKQFLKMKGTKIQPVKRMTDVPGAKINQGGGYRENVIYLPEEIMQNGHWVKNDDLSFRLRHEIGHALNEESGVISGIPNSDRREFIKVFKEDLANASDESLRQLQLPLDQLQVARDEVYADTYGHVTSPTRSNARYSQLLRSTFPNCFKYLSKEIRG